MIQKLEFRLHVKGPESSQDFTLPVGQAVLGRDPSCEVLLAFPLVSRRHARFTCSESECEIVDLGSANGTSVNGVKLTPEEPASLADGAVITIGPFEILVEAAKVETTQAEADEEPQPVKEQPPAAKKPEPAPQQEKAPVKPVKKAAKPADEKESGQAATPPPPIPPQKISGTGLPGGSPFSGITSLPGLGTHSLRLVDYLPGIYNTDFMSRFLALFESILTPIEWNVDHFDMYLDPGTAPLGFLPWLANWYTIIFDSTWSEAQRRSLLKEAHQIYARRGTRWALSRVLEIYLGQKPEISEFTLEKEPFTFIVNLAIKEDADDNKDHRKELIEAIIDASKPAHTTYRLTFK